MTEPDHTGNPDPTGAQPPAAAHPEPRLIRSKRTRLSLVWLVPLLALAIGGALVVRSILATGPRIEIEFNTAEGLAAGKTEVRFKEVVVGRVDAVRLSDNRRRVIVTVQLDRAAASLAVADTNFWVVRPRIGVGGVSGIGTLLSGAYIGVDAGKAEEPRSRFTGLEVPPYVLRGEPGEVFILRARDLGSLEIGSPVYYRRIRVGRVVGTLLDPVADELTVKVFIEDPYQRLVTAHTRFWNASGVDLSVDANGLTVNTQSVASVLAGGVAFEQAPDTERGAPATSGTPFRLYLDRRSAMAPARGPAMPVRLVFDGSVRGLAVDAPLDFLGIEVGKVRSISPQFNAAQQRIPILVTAELYPLRLGAARSLLSPRRASAPGAASAPAPAASLPAGQEAALLQRLVDNGLRAQLRNGNLLTGQLYVALDFYPKAAPVGRLQASAGVLALPTLPGALSELQGQVADIVGKLSKMPFDEIGVNLASALRQTDTTLKELTPEARQAITDARQAVNGAQQLLTQLGPEAQATLADLRRTMAGAQQAIERMDRNLLDERAPLQQRMEGTLAEMQRAAQSLRVLTDLLQRQPDSLLRGKTADPALPEAVK